MRGEPSPQLIRFCRELAVELREAPSYLQPTSNVLLLDSAQSCLDAIELCIQWEVEQLYGVEGEGPFDEF
jgi:hypothetical protein